MRWISISNTRLAGALSLVALILITISDFTFQEFWDTNAMATSIVADVLVLIVGVAVVNEFIAARSRDRWRLVAEYGLIELARSARRIWVGLAEVIGVGDRADQTRDELRGMVRDQVRTGELERAAKECAATSEGRRRLHVVISELVIDSRAALTSWAPVLVESAHSDAIARFAELQSLIGRLDLVLDMEAQGKRPSPGESPDPGWIAKRVAAILNLGTELAPELWESAERIQEREARELSSLSSPEPGSGASAGGG
jgi:hypothetical protein